MPDELPRFVGPEGWVPEAITSAMRLLQFRLPGSGQPDGPGYAELVVAVWPGGIGPREGNLDRWVHQMGLDLASSALGPGQRWEEDVRHFRVTTLHLEGAYTAQDAQAAEFGAAMLASWIEVPGEARVWTVKATGPRATLERWRPAYMAFIGGL